MGNSLGILLVLHSSKAEIKPFLEATTVMDSPEWKGTRSRTLPSSSLKAVLFNLWLTKSSRAARLSGCRLSMSLTWTLRLKVEPIKRRNMFLSFIYNNVSLRMALKYMLKGKSWI